MIYKKSLLWKLLLPIPVAFLIVMFMAWIRVPEIIADNARDTAVDSALQTVNQYKVLRSYYTNNVISKVLANSVLKPAIDHAGSKYKIPLPATMIHDLSAQLAEQGISIKLYSQFPFPNRLNRQLDDFQNQAWDYLNANPDKIYSRQITQDEREVIRVAVADQMVLAACVHCHNTHPQSPKLDWKLGDVRGVLEVTQVIDKQLMVGQQLSNQLLIAVALSGLLTIALIVMLTRRHVVQPLALMTASAERMSQGDLSVRVADDYDTEVAELASTFNRMAENLSKKELRESEHLKKLSEAANIKEEVSRLCAYVEKVAAGDLCSRLEISGNDELAGLSRNLNTMTENLANITRDILNAADVITDRVERVEQSMASQSESASRQAQAAESSAATLFHITDSADWTMTKVTALGEAAERTQEQGNQGLVSVQSAIVATDDMRVQADSVAQTILSLSDRTKEIGQITGAVRNLAMQSKVLAFNASIEAAKSGEAGKGFAVVAQEVRALAEQSEEATQQVQQLLGGILKATDTAVMTAEQGSKSVEHGIALIEEGGSAIQQLAETIQGTVSSSKEIVVAVREQTNGINSVRSKIGSFRDNTQQMVDAANHALDASKELRALTKELKDKVSVYRIE